MSRSTAAAPAGKEAEPIDPELEALAALPQVGLARARLLRKLGLRTREDLLLHLPFRFEDRRQFKRLAACAPGDTVTYRGLIAAAKSSRWRGGRQVFEITLTPPGPVSVGDETLTARWFNMYYLPKMLTKGKEVIVHGKLGQGKKGGWSLMHPDFELVVDDEDAFIHLNRITPVYPSTEGLSQRVMRRLMYANTQAEDLPIAEPAYRVPEGLPSLRESLPAAHFPPDEATAARARGRLAYDELVRLQLVLARRRRARLSLVRDRGAWGDSRLAEAFLERLHFEPTGAQRRVMAELARDLQQSVPMNRLLQGDVGAGKTLVAVYAMLLAVGRGEQAALMAPTEILAEQHSLNLRRWLEPLGVRVGLHTGSKKEGVGEADLFAAKSETGGVAGSIVVGTHALFYEGFEADRLGLVVIDEQHKFGVLQREALARKGYRPDVLVMTATPIPRTLSLTLYGDLEVSVLDELPPGRTPIKTAVRKPAELAKFWQFMAGELAAGRQAYIVMPLVEESDKVEAKAVTAEYEEVQARFPDYQVGLLHGRMKPEDKERVMTAFREGRLRILVSTAVIEVGVDVANATLMVIENAERFGL
ncbi:MAG: ATP-dependent DNA helicase RecG, partial [Verrucomicrobiota bacterium]